MSERFTGRVVVVDGQGREVFQFDSNFAVLDMGAQGNEADLRLRGDDGNFKIHLDGGQQLISVRDGQGREAFRLDANSSVLDLGAQGNEGDLRIRGDDGQFKIHLDGGTGDIKLSGADCAEDFDVVDEAGNLDPGSVMSIGDGGRLRGCSEAYDKRVAGVISGAGSYRSGIILDSQRSQGDRLPLALTGKVYCQVDAGYHPIEVGDLLTTSSTLGHAMKAEDASRAFGATIGKALHPLASGKGLIPVLIALQ